MAILEVKVIENKRLSPEVGSLILERPKDFNFKAGQFIMVKTPAGIRPYSIASSPKKDFIELCIKDAGRVSDYLCNLKKDSKLLIRGPQGSFTFRESPRGATFIATGTGIAPLKSMIEDIFEKGYSKKCILIFGTKTKKDIIYRELFENFEKIHPNFKYLIALSREENWDGYKGHVDLAIEDNFELVKDCDFYICGLRQMVDEVSRLLISKKISEDRIFFEKYN